MQSRKGFIVLTGEVGTGKTTMLECLRDHLDSHHIPFAFLFNSRLTPDQFLEMIAYDFDLQCTRTSKTEILFALNNMLIERANQNKTTALIVDEAQNLEWEVLEEIRMLGNLENRRGKMLQIILSGQPELDRKLEEQQYPPIETADCAALPPAAVYRIRNRRIHRRPAWRAPACASRQFFRRMCFSKFTGARRESRV